MRKIILLTITLVSFLMEANAQDFFRKKSNLFFPREGVEPKIPKANFSVLSARGATSIDTFSISHAFYTAVYAAANPPLRCYGNVYTSLGATQNLNESITSYNHPSSDGSNMNIMTVFDTLYQVGASASSPPSLLRKAYLIDSSVSVKIDTVLLICGLAVEDTMTRNFAGDSVKMSLWSVDKASKAKISLLKTVSYTGQAELEKFFNSGFYYNARFPFDNFVLPAGITAIGFDIEYITVHQNKNVLLVRTNYLDSCQTLVIGGNTFRSFAHRPLFQNYTTWNLIDSTGPSTTMLRAENNGFAYSATGQLAGIPANCRFVDKQNVYIFPTVIVESKFYANLNVNPNKVSFCANEKVILFPDIKGGKEPFTYNWTATSGTIDNPTDPAIELSLGSTNSNVKLVIKDANGDSLVLTRTVTISNLSVSISPSKTALVGCIDSAILTANVTGGTGSQYSWSSGGSTSNKLTVKNAGTYTVTVTSTAGCTATATSPAISSSFSAPALDFSFTPSTNICPNKDVEFKVASSALRLGWVYNWSETSTSLATSGETITHAFSSSGTKAVKLNADSAGCKASEVSKNVTVLAATSTQCNKVSIALAENDNLKIFPNPVRDGKVYIQNDLNQSLTYRVTDMLGKVIASDKLSTNKDGHIDLSNAPNGIYFIELDSKGERMIKKIVVDKQ
jgi:hypothetical protein